MPPDIPPIKTVFKITISGDIISRDNVTVAGLLSSRSLVRNVAARLGGDCLGGRRGRGGELPPISTSNIAVTWDVPPCTKVLHRENNRGSISPQFRTSRIRGNIPSDKGTRGSTFYSLQKNPPQTFTQNPYLALVRRINLLGILGGFLSK